MRRLKRYAQRGPARRIWQAINQLSDIVTANELRPSNTISVDRTTAGTIAKVRNNRKKSAAADNPFRTFIVSEVKGTYLICSDVDDNGAAVADTSYLVWKPEILGFAQTYSDADAQADSVAMDGDDKTGQTRKVTYTFTANALSLPLEVTEHVFPLYEAGSVIFASAAPEFYANREIDGARVEWIDINREARHWRTPRSLVTVCVNEESKYTSIPISSIRNGDGSNYVP